ncbi:GerMN domain-containing protein [Paenibacillus sp. F411]|uniref:GerMN domain-containing protein n=1 Tax=Paenibacillus sp. F411 TaxID=2820239 RepID=UPI001AAF3F84|nr:GerMN domain-containing protein [Paenibacillus sp. F411]MBO2943117.1 GerMN domain-containing protein [Paenibacillus sp. F411]
MSQRKYWSAAILAAVMVMSSGCGDKPAAAPPADTGAVKQAAGADEGNVKDDVDTTQQAQGTAGTQTAGNSTSASDGEKKEEPMRKEKVVLYYTDPELMGVVEAPGEIMYNGAEDKYAKAFNALQQSDDEEFVPLWNEAITLNQVEFDAGALVLDITKPAEANLGAGGEMYALEAMKNMFFQFEEVQSIQLLIDGEQVESLMGHVVLEHPMKRPTP